MSLATTSQSIANFFASTAPSKLVCAISGFALLSSLVAQYLLGMDPCPLCLTQRLIFITLFLAGMLWHLAPPGGAVYRAIAVIPFALGLTGVGIVGYHLSLLTGLIDSGCNITFPMFIGQVQDLMPESALILLDGTGSCSPEVGSVEYLQTYGLLGCAMVLFLSNVVLSLRGLMPSKN